MTMQHERRKSIRVNLDLPLTVETVRGEVEQQTTMVNCCIDGLCYRRKANGLSRKGEEVFMTFTPEQIDKPVRVLGWVVHEKQVDDDIETGVTFMFLKKQHEQTISQMIGNDAFA